MEPRGDDRFLRARARLGELPYTMLASTKEVMALSCSRWRRGRVPAPQLGAERKKGMQLWVPLRGSDRGIWGTNGGAQGSLSRPLLPLLTCMGKQGASWLQVCVQSAPDLKAAVLGLWGVCTMSWSIH